MTEKTQEPRRAAVKLLAIVGFLAVAMLILWSIMQGVRVFPQVFSSLASIAETINGYRTQSELVIDLEKNIVNSGETFTLNWTDMGKGTYAFKYVCMDGITLAVRTSEGLLQNVPCTDTLSLPNEVHGLFVSIQTQEQRFSDVPLSVTFDSETGDDHVAESRVTIVNATIPTKIAVAPVVDDVKEVPVSTPEPVVTVPKKTEIVPTPKPPKTAPVPSPAPSPTQPAATVVALIPKSYENGFIDLRTSYLGVGTIVDGTFVPKATFDRDDKAAFRFEVKNIGTKVSGDWSYTLILPGAVEYISDTQTGLMPNERAVYTVGFDLAETSKSTVTVSGRVTVKNDTDTKNNNFEWSVKVTE